VPVQTEKEHAAALAAVRAQKDAAEAAQEIAQRQLKEELERMRTQFMFKVLALPAGCDSG
jgi:hypothetical protein